MFFLHGHVAKDVVVSTSLYRFVSIVSFCIDRIVLYRLYIVRKRSAPIAVL